ncbi:arginine--tRNA ligase, chloroplastic/mitochondrial [Tanacetum coccineum]
MELSTPKTIPSTNTKYDRSTLRLEILYLFKDLLKSRYPEAKDYAIIRPLKGAGHKYGDYVCFSVLEICEELRIKDQYLFDKQQPQAIAREIIKEFEKSQHFPKSTKPQKPPMINKLFQYDVGLITFKLNGYWMARRIKKMLIDGIDTWAPRIFELKRRARALFVFPANTIATAPDMNADMFRAHFIKDALVNMFLFSGVDVGSGFCNDMAKKTAQKHFMEKQGVIESERQPTPLFYVRGPSNDVYTDLATLWYGVHMQKADVMAAKNEGWLRVDWKATPTCCGYRTFSREQEEKLAGLWYKYLTHSKDVPLSKLGMAEETFFECALKFTFLKSHRLAECTFNIEEMLDVEENSFVYLLKTQAFIRSLIKNSTGRNLFNLEKALTGKERELGLHLLEFTEVRPGQTILGLCKATEVVMNKCFHLLGIAPDSSLAHSYHWAFLSYVDRPVKEARATNYHIIPSSEADARPEILDSRFELFTMNVGVTHSNFDQGNIFGSVSVVDTYGSRPDGWIKLDVKDCCYVSYFNHEWYDSVGTYNGSYIPFGDPSCRHSIPFASSIEVQVLLHATSKKKDQCYLLCNSKDAADLSKFWDDKSEDTKCGTLKFDGKDGRILMDYIVIKHAIDTTMELTFDSKVPVRVCGSIMAYYGDDVLKDCGFLGQYKALIFRTDPVHNTFIGHQQLPLHKSALAVPANGCLNIEAFLIDLESKKTIVDTRVKYLARPGSVDEWKIEGKNFTFNLKVAWIGADKC